MIKFLILCTLLINQLAFAERNDKVKRLGKQAGVELIYIENSEENMKITGYSKKFKYTKKMIDSLKELSLCKRVNYEKPSHFKNDKNMFLLTCFKK